MYDSISYELPQIGAGNPIVQSLDGWLIVAAISNPTEEWKNLPLPVLQLRVTTPDGKAHSPLTDEFLAKLKNKVLELQGVHQCTMGFVNEHPAPSGVGTFSADGIVLSFSPPNHESDPPTAKLFSVNSVWSLELAPKQSFRLPLLFDCPKNSRPVTLTWPKVGCIPL